MDSREQQGYQAETEQVKDRFKDLDTQQVILKVDSLKLNNSFKDAIILNLVNKNDTKAVMEKVYEKELEYVESFPKELKYYIHFPQLSYTTGLGILCGASLLNELGRYNRIKTCNSQNWVKYVEARDNYDYLLNKQLSNGGITFKDIMKYFFRIDIDTSYKRIKYLFFDDLLNDDVITSQFF